MGWCVLQQQGKDVFTATADGQSKERKEGQALLIQAACSKEKSLFLKTSKKKLENVEFP